MIIMVLMLIMMMVMSMVMMVLMMLMTMMMMTLCCWSGSRVVAFLTLLVKLQHSKDIQLASWLHVFGVF